MNPSGNATVSLQADSGLVDDFDEWVAGSDYSNRSEALRALMRDAAERPTDHDTPLRPPVEEDLEKSYRVLCDLANKDGIVRDKTAKSVLASRLGIDQNEVMPMILKKLHRRNYLRRQSNLQGSVTWKLNGWEE